MMILPPLEIAEQLRFEEGTVYFVGELTEEQLKLFNDYKDKLEEAYKIIPRVYNLTSIYHFIDELKNS